MQKKIEFSPPYFLEEDFEEVVKVLKSGWITTGPRVKEFETLLSHYTGAKATLCVSSATAAMQILLTVLGVGPGDEVITTVYTYTATASVIHHVGAKIVFADTSPGSFNISPEEIKQRLTPKTKAVIAVDYAGIPCDYDEILEVLNRPSFQYDFKKGSVQDLLGRPVLLSDASHSLGAQYKGIKMGAVADVTAFSFHAVKNLTTAEGGAIQIKENPRLSIEELISQCRLYSLHGQDKDAWMKEKGSYRYDIKLLGYKFNMTDIQAALGICQLKRYPAILEKRKALFAQYAGHLKHKKPFILPSYDPAVKTGSYHLFPLRLTGFNEVRRDALIEFMKSKDITINVHFIPLPMFTAYKQLGFDIQDFSNAYAMFENVVTLPVHLQLDLQDVDRICEELINGVK